MKDESSPAIQETLNTVSSSPQISRPQLWICLNFSDLPLDIFNRHEQQVSNAFPLAIAEKNSIRFINQAAEDAGIRTGQSTDTAFSLCNAIKIIERDKQKEARALAQLAQWAYAFTSRVSIEPPFCLLLEISGSLRLFKGLESLKRQILGRLAPTGYIATLSLGPTAPVSLLLAKARVHNNPEHRVEDTLARLAVDYMDVDSRVITSLHQAGIRDMGDLLAIHNTVGGTYEIARRYGPELATYLRQLQGQAPAPRRYISPRPGFFSEVSFLSELTELGPLLFPAKKLLSELCQFLSSRHLAISRIDWQIGHRKQEKILIQIPLAQPANNYDMFFMLTRLRMERGICQDTKGITEINSLSLMARKFSPARQASENLFDHRPSLTLADSPFREETAQLLNQLHVKLGENTCFGLSVNNDHRPELAWKAVRFSQGHPDQEHPENHEALDQLSQVNPRPLFLLRHPQALQEQSIQEQFRFISGPERIDFGWWDHQELIEKNRQRDYFIAQHTTGSLCWIYSYQGHWHLHGFFS